MGISEAMSTSKSMVMKAGFWEHLALVLIGFVIVVVANGALAIIATPFLVVLVTAAYFLADDNDAALAKA